MIVSKVLLKDLITNHLKQENGLNEVLQITLNSMMKNERSLHLQQADGNKAIGYRPGRVYGHGKPSAYLIDVDHFYQIQKKLKLLEGVVGGEKAILEDRVVSHSDAKKRMT